MRSSRLSSGDFTKNSATGTCTVPPRGTTALTGRRQNGQMELTARQKKRRCCSITWKGKRKARQVQVTPPRAVRRQVLHVYGAHGWKQWAECHRLVVRTGGLHKLWRKMTHPNRKNSRIPSTDLALHRCTERSGDLPLVPPTSRHTVGKVPVAELIHFRRERLFRLQRKKTDSPVHVGLGVAGFNQDRRRDSEPLASLRSAELREGRKDSPTAVGGIGTVWASMVSGGRGGVRVMTDCTIRVPELQPDWATSGGTRLMAVWVAVAVSWDGAAAVDTCGFPRIFFFGTERLLMGAGGTPVAIRTWPAGQCVRPWKWIYVPIQCFTWAVL